MLSEKERFELFWEGDPEELRKGFATMRNNVLQSGRDMSVDQVLQFLSSFWRVVPAANWKRQKASYDRMLI